MKATDILKELGFSDEQLKTFFKGQREVKRKLKQVNDVRQQFDVGIETVAYTPRKLVNRLKANISDTKLASDKDFVNNYKGKANINDLKDIENQQNVYENNNYPPELVDLFTETVKMGNQWAEMPYDITTIKNAIDKYAPNYSQLFDELTEISDTFVMYDGANDYVANSPDTALYYVLNNLKVLLFS